MPHGTTEFRLNRQGVFWRFYSVFVQPFENRRPLVLDGRRTAVGSYASNGVSIRCASPSFLHIASATKKQGRKAEVRRSRAQAKFSGEKQTLNSKYDACFTLERMVASAKGNLNNTASRKYSRYSNLVLKSGLAIQNSTVKEKKYSWNFLAELAVRC
ncbi:hypothetical protein [Ruegeria denitrificans]|uniref:hypothetical protein n=1 Tax=Ruegeria denitrificans TaxID=1715692 RepID=UPI0010401094|nr:hypothetical protein [Ruegeria denitrificans]